MAEMNTVLGLLGFAVFIVGVIALAAAVTYGVVKLLPAREPEQSKPAG